MPESSHDTATPPPPDSWPGAGGARSVAPLVPSWPGAATVQGVDSWPGAGPQKKLRRPKNPAGAAPARRRPSRVAAILFPAVAAVILFILVAVWASIDPDHRALQMATLLTVSVLVLGLLVLAGYRQRR
ncbi:hypothetical protein [Austwickia chelonae]|uniref:hypothetical protein n=1 Tax=Austwickia chelonae TaxID=100225 RepID=UPI000E27C558|nr:hypothetical protein [Austwickia chelonae]